MLLIVWRKLRWPDWRQLVQVMSLVEAEEMLMTHTRDRGDAQRYSLSDVDISWLNRRVSGKHSHKVGRRIYSFEGLVRIRYNHGLAHELDPEDPLRVARHTNEVAEKDPLLASVPLVPLLGACANAISCRSLR